MMLSLKKMYRDELLQLAILLSLLRIEPNEWSARVPAIGVGGGHEGSWEYAAGRDAIRVHPKSLGGMAEERRVLGELSRLGRYNRAAALWQNVTAYMGLTYNPEDLAASTSGESGQQLHWAQEPPSTSHSQHLVDVHDEDEDSLSPEDMDLIEVLWKQDVDMGFSIEEWQQEAAGLSSPAEDPVTIKDEGGIFKDKLKDMSLAESTHLDKTKKEKEDDEDDKSETNNENDDQWHGIPYTIDVETGEYIVKEEQDTSDEETVVPEDEPPSSILPDQEFSLEEALQLVGLNDDLQLLDESGEEVGWKERRPRRESESGAGSLSPPGVSPPASPLLEPDQEPGDEEELALIDEMIHGPTQPPYHPSVSHIRSPIQGRMGYMRAGSMEQRWQDLASLLSLPEPHYLSGAAAVAHHQHQAAAASAPQHQDVKPPAGLPPPHLHHPHDHPATPYSPHAISSGNVGSAVASSMNLMTNSSEPMGGEAGATAFKMENTHEMMYYQNGTSEINHNSDGFLSSILNDEDLQLMDMAMTEATAPGMYSMRMLEGASGGGGDSDSAVSSMGSERVPSLSSDTEWMETNSDSGQTPDHYQEYSRGKYRWYDYGYGRQLSGEASNMSRGQSSVAQKKHHMYGKRMFHDQATGIVGNGSVCSGGLPLKSEYTPNMSPAIAPNYPVHPDLKYSCSVDFSRQTIPHPGVRSTPSQIAAHNHTYHMLPEECSSQQRPLARDKKDTSWLERHTSDLLAGRKSDEETHLTRDERRARALNIPIPVDDIINLPMDEFNERLSKYDLSETQLSLIRDIRRRGKNKVAAQNCRKRKLDQILSLADEVKQMREKKQRLIHERQVLLAERHKMKSKFSQLYRHIFQSLRDADGNPYNPYEWSLQQAADGTVVLVPRGNQTILDQSESSPRKP